MSLSVGLSPPWGKLYFIGHVEACMTGQSIVHIHLWTMCFSKIWFKVFHPLVTGNFLLNSLFAFIRARSSFLSSSSQYSSLIAWLGLPRLHSATIWSYVLATIELFHDLSNSNADYAGICTQNSLPGLNSGCDPFPCRAVDHHNLIPSCQPPKPCSFLQEKPDFKSNPAQPQVQVSVLF